jgi:hypothetical protein
MVLALEAGGYIERTPGQARVTARVGTTSATSTPRMNARKGRDFGVIA